MPTINARGLRKSPLVIKSVWPKSNGYSKSIRRIPSAWDPEEAPIRLTLSTIRRTIANRIAIIVIPGHPKLTSASHCTGHEILSRKPRMRWRASFHFPLVCQAKATLEPRQKADLTIEIRTCFHIGPALSETSPYPDWLLGSP